LVGVWRFYLWQRRAIHKRADPAKLERYPSLSVIRPIKGLDTGMEENLRAALDHGYPGEVETFFVFEDENEPALPLVETALAERISAGPFVKARVLFSGQPPANRTGKLHSMIAGLKASKNELVAFVDSDVRQDQEALRVLVETLLAAEGAGAAFAPVVASEPPATVGDVGHALMLNALYEPAALATADKFGGELPFIMGHFMVFKREAIEAIGGLENAEGQLVDDMFLGRRLNECGYRNKVSPHPVAIIQRGSTVREFVPTFTRWLAFSRSGLPVLSFKLRYGLIGAAFWGSLIIALWAATAGQPLLASLATLVPLSVAATANDLHYRIVGARLPLKYHWVSLVLWLIAPLAYAQILTKREVAWRGRVYRLDMHSRLGYPRF
ncbi:MAG TPA: glycosyltransferase, partial [Methylococcaceae bacterium]|nr:glycosyltransferase [Methylococcaceae bacterium]